MAARKQTLTGNFSRRTYRRYRKFLELATSPFSSCVRLIATRVNDVTNYFSLIVELRLKLSTGISDARATQLCRSSVGTTVKTKRYMSVCMELKFDRK